MVYNSKTAHLKSGA